MKYNKEQNKDFALKLVLIEITNLVRLAQSIRLGDNSQKELNDIIKRYE